MAADCIPGEHVDVHADVFPPWRVVLHAHLPPDYPEEPPTIRVGQQVRRCVSEHEGVCVCCVMCAICCVLRVACCMLHVVYYGLRVACCVLYVVSCMLCVLY